MDAPSTTSTPTTYTHGHAEAVLSTHRWRTAANSAAHLVPLLRPGLDLLDVGSGAGTITADLAGLVAPGRVAALELSEAAIGLTRAELERRGVEGVEYLVGDVHALDLPDDCFDVVHAHQVLQHVADPVAALRELRRVTRPGGIVAVRDSDYGAFAWHPPAAGLDAWIAAYRDQARANGGEPDAGRRLPAWCREAGLTDVVAGSSTWCFATPEDRAWWAGTWAARVTSTALADQWEASGRADAAAREGMARALRSWADAPDGWFSVLHGEVVARV